MAPVLEVLTGRPRDEKRRYLTRNICPIISQFFHKVIYYAPAIGPFSYAQEHSHVEQQPVRRRRRRYRRSRHHLGGRPNRLYLAFEDALLVS